MYTDEQEGRTLAGLLEQVLGESGFDVELVFAQRNAFYGEWLLNHEVTESGEWDIAAVSWYADYFAGGSYIPILLDGRGYAAGTPNYGGYNNDELNAIIDSALAAATPEEAAELWAEADLRGHRGRRLGADRLLQDADAARRPRRRLPVPPRAAQRRLRQRLAGGLTTDGCVGDRSVP